MKVPTTLGRVPDNAWVWNSYFTKNIPVLVLIFRKLGKEYLSAWQNAYEL